MLMLPSYSNALPIHQKSSLEDSILKLDILKPKAELYAEKPEIQSKNTKVDTDLSNLIVQLGRKINLSQHIEDVVQRKKRWDANLIALTLRDRMLSSDTLRGVASKISDDVPIYDPFGGGVWGKKKRSVPDFDDFDYDGEDL